MIWYVKLIFIQIVLAMTGLGEPVMHGRSFQL
jgi:hypothetical protein